MGKLEETDLRFTVDTFEAPPAKTMALSIPVPDNANAYHMADMMAHIIARQFNQLTKEHAYYQFLTARTIDLHEKSGGTSVLITLKAFDPSDAGFDRQLLDAYGRAQRQNQALESTLMREMNEVFSLKKSLKPETLRNIAWQ